MSNSSHKNLFFANLDGLRFFAFLAVFFAHSFYSEITDIQNSEVYVTARNIGHLGIFGVNFFFVLSGFLITYLLLLEKSNDGIDIGYFYVRRILRIWPLYYLVVVIGFVVVPEVQHFLGNEDYSEKAPLTPYLLFISNMYVGSESQTAILGVLWSIAVEEQFYLFWPLLLRVISFKKLPYAFVMIIVISAILRQWVIGYGYENTFSCMSDLAIGSLMAYCSFSSTSFILFFKNLKTRTISLVYFLGVILFAFRGFWTQLETLYLHERLIYSLFFGFIILEQNYSENSFYKMGNYITISKWGNYTYGLYMLHFVAIYVVAKILKMMNLNDSIWTVMLFEPLLSFLLSLFLAYMSYHFFEKPFLRLKRKFSIIR